MKKYEAPQLRITLFAQENVVTASGVTQANLLQEWSQDGTRYAAGLDFATLVAFNDNK